MHPQWCQQWDLPQAPVMFELALQAVLQRPVPQFTPVPKHQAVERDIAVVVKESVTHAQLMASCPEYQEIARSQLSQKELDLKSLNTEKEGE